MKHLPVVVVLIMVCLTLAVFAGPVSASVVVPSGGGTPGTSRNFELVGHNSLFDRGMNAAAAVLAGHGKVFVYIGSRTDGSNRCGVSDPRDLTGTQDICPHVRPGIQIVDATDPSNPTVVGEIGPPFAANVNETTRELRVWPEKELLIVLSFRCSPLIHACVGGQVTPTYRFFSLDDPVTPRHILTFVPKQTTDNLIRVPHEFFLWVDPEDEDRALIFESDPTSSTDPNRPNLTIRDISEVPDGGEPVTVAEGNWNSQFEGGGDSAGFDSDLSLHSMGVSADGKRTHLAYLRGNYLMLDTSKVAKNEVPPGTVESLNDDLLTRPANRPRWGAGSVCAGHTALGCAESHSSVPVPGRDLVFNIDEVYGNFTAPSFGWPWAWARLIDVRDPAHPVIVGEYKIFENTDAFKAQAEGDPVTQGKRSYGAHNPTVLPKLVFESWHSGGLQAIDIRRASHPRQAGWFSPTPLDSVATEDPGLSQGDDIRGNKVEMWSYPIIVNGLIFVIDVRNGLYILRYTGHGARDVARIGFLEGNSNLGDALRLAGLED